MRVCLLAWRGDGVLHEVEYNGGWLQHMQQRAYSTQVKQASAWRRACREAPV